MSVDGVAMTSGEAFPVGTDATGQCSRSTSEKFFSGCTVTSYSLLAVPMTITDGKTKKNISFTNSYNCTKEGTCDYAVPYNCTEDNTCAGDANKAGWTYCDAQTNKNCGFTVRDMTLIGNTIHLQNPDLNGGQYAAIAVHVCPEDSRC